MGCTNVSCVSFAYLGPAPLCVVGQILQRTPLRHINDYNNLQSTELTSNQVVGSSNLSGRANIYYWQCSIELRRGVTR